ncbi:NACHT domain-containing protein [Pseudanabaena sp. FACHB-1998]|uniref:NACHT domain-containing protein n=1 Tax=Pseudanabaena sp. FACHB-1998 TaxID=2692858 RepID=UPI0016803FB0|nr:NACHT domain-containing protein [Pseudanabaena sp. FACHB-1998]MBD2179410.1 NACHT domain-containing protein [Pseudanabaena sp. FACHB-1998]
MARLSQSLHNNAISLDLQLQPEKVKSPWDKDIKIGKLSSENLPIGTSMLSVFERPEIQGNLLILGEPGSGKTTMTLELSLSLIQKAESDQEFPIPVLFDLTSWSNVYPSLREWLVVELSSSTKRRVREDIAQKLIDEKKLLLILDSLDELKPDQQGICVQAINNFLQSEFRPQYLVVCSRNEEYETFSKKLELNGAVYINDLTDSKIQDYLDSQKKIELWQVFKEDEALLDLVRKPLMLNITVLSYEELSIEEWHKAASLESRRSLLWDTYIKRMLKRDLKNLSYRKYNSDKTQKWLSFLAQRLQNEFQNEFLIEKMQPSWLLSGEQIQSYNLLLGLFSFAIIFLISFAACQFSNIGYKILLIIIGVTTFIWSVIERHEIRIKERIDFSWNSILNAFTFGFKLYYSFPISRASLILIFFMAGWERVVIVFVSTGLMSSIFLFPFQLKFLEIEEKLSPNQGIKQSGLNWILASSLCALLGIGVQNVMMFRAYLGFLIGIEPFEGMIREQGLAQVFIPNPITMAAIGAQITFALIGRVFIQHLSLRLVLFFNNLIPWNYAHFLDYCYDLLLLQRVRGRYRFIHESLQEHFSNIKLEEETQ